MTDPRVDQYIARAPDFARPILEHLRTLVHRACPEVQETIKWGFPNFEYHGILCSIAAFKQHCAFGFWKRALLANHPALVRARTKTSGDAMGALGAIRSLADLPPDRVLLALIMQAAKLNEDGVKAPTRPRTKRPAPRIPAAFAAALDGAEGAKENFDRLAPSHRRDYIEWITEAKTPATRERRIATAVEWIAEGKSRNWKYERR